jgi:hypothetical protein
MFPERDDAASRIAIDDSNRGSASSGIGGLDGDPDISTTASLALNDSHAEPDRSTTPLKNFTSALKLTTVGR